MSVLLTAGAKKGGLRPKSAKAKAKKPTTTTNRSGGAVAPPAPPTSDERHSVWYWELDGEPMTVIFDKVTHQVWCNGLEPELLEGLGDDYMIGPVVQFGIYAKNTGSLHHGCIRSVYEGEGDDGDQLYVNDCLIMEHACRPYHHHHHHHAATAMIPMHGRDVYGTRLLPPYATDELPSYEEAILQPLTYLKLGEPKKNK